jgi:dihydroflavonol-4-reductase
VRKLIDAGHHVRIITRPQANRKVLDGLVHENAIGDITDWESVMAACQGCDAIIHCASLTAQVPNDFSFYESINVKGTVNMVEAARKTGIKRFVYISTANTIGPGTKEKPGTELSDFSMFRYGSGYINSKYLAQQYVLEQAERSGLQAIVLNPTFMIGPYDQRPSSGEMVLRALRQKIQFVPHSGKNFVHVSDVALAAVAALTRGKPGQCYLIANENLSYWEFFSRVCQVCNTKAIQITIPKIVLSAIGYLGTAMNFFFHCNSPVTHINMRIVNTETYYSGSKAERELGIHYTPVDQGIRDAAEWFSGNGYLQKNRNYDSVLTS